MMTRDEKLEKVVNAPENMAEHIYFERRDRHIRRIYRDNRGVKRIQDLDMKTINAAKRESRRIQKLVDGGLGFGSVRRAV